MDYHRFNQKFVIKPYPLPRIVNIIQHMGVFQYVITLDINTLYYTINISPKSQYMMTIVTEFGKFGFIHLPMSMYYSGDIFKAKVDNMVCGIEAIKIYIDNIFVLIKDILSNHIKQLRIVFDILSDARLKVNAPKCSLGLKEIPYLGCLITQEGIKPYPRKEQGIMDPRRTTTMNEA